MPRARPEFPDLVDELAALVGDLHMALRDALKAQLPEACGARACGRALGLSRGLGWSVYTVFSVADPPVVLRSMPRGKGWTQVLARLAKVGCTPAQIAAVQEASDRLLARLEVVGLDRVALRAAAAGGLDTGPETTAMTQARRAMRASAEQVLGLRAQAQIGAFLVGAPDRKGRVDIVGTVEYEALRRIRPGFPFPIHQRVHAWHPKWRGLKASLPLRLDGAVAGLVTDLSTRGIAETEVRMGVGDEDRTIFFHGEGTLGGSGIRVAFAEHLRKGGTVGSADDRVELDLSIHQPVAYAVMEVWVHRSIARVTEPAALLVGMYGSASRLGTRPDRLRIPLEAEAKMIDDPALPARIRGDAAKHATLLRRGARTLNSSLDELVGFRVVVPDPPIGSRVMLKWRM